MPTNTHSMNISIRPILGSSNINASSRFDIIIKHNQNIDFHNIQDFPPFNNSIFNSSSHTLTLTPLTAKYFKSPPIHNSSLIYNSFSSTFYDTSIHTITIAPNYPIRRYINA